MTIRVRCPNGHLLGVPDDREGTRIRCPKCKEPFEAEALADKPEPRKPAARTPPDSKKPASPSRKRRDADDDDDEGDTGSAATPEERRKQRQRDRREGLRKVSLGLLLHIIRLWATTVLIFFLLLGVVFASIVAASAQPNVERLSNEATAIFSAIAFGCAILVIVLAASLPILGLVGSGFCCFVPAKAEARGLIITSIVFDVVALLASLLQMLAFLFVSDPAKRERFEQLVQAGGIFFSFAALFAFILFMRQVAFYLKKTLLASAAMNVATWLIVVVITGPVVYLGLIFLSVLIVVMLGPVLSVGALFLVIIIWFALFYYLWFRPVLSLIANVRGAIEESV